MKKFLFLATVVAMSLAVTMPVNAQSRKEKKAAAKAQWEMEQEQKREEDQLRHQMRMDSLRNAQKMQQEAQERAKAEMEREDEARRAAEADARERLQREEERNEIDIKDEPCTEVGSTDTYIRARATAVSMNQQMARTKAQTDAVRDLGAKIGSTVQALIKRYVNEEAMSVYNDEMSGDAMTYEEKTEGMVKQKVDQHLSFTTYCEKTRIVPKPKRDLYKCYMTVQAGKEEVLKPIYDDLQKEKLTKLNIDYNHFSEEFDKEFNKDAAPAE